MLLSAMVVSVPMCCYEVLVVNHVIVKYFFVVLCSKVLLAINSPSAFYFFRYFCWIGYSVAYFSRHCRRLFEIKQYNAIIFFHNLFLIFLQIYYKHCDILQRIWYLVGVYGLPFLWVRRFITIKCMVKPLRL